MKKLKITIPKTFRIFMIIKNVVNQINTFLTELVEAINQLKEDLKFIVKEIEKLKKKGNKK